MKSKFASSIGQLVPVAMKADVGKAFVWIFSEKIPLVGSFADN